MRSSGGEKKGRAKLPSRTHGGSRLFFFWKQRELEVSKKKGRVKGGRGNWRNYFGEKRKRIFLDSFFFSLLCGFFSLLGKKRVSGKKKKKSLSNRTFFS